jgi:hypothetical protein
MMLCAFSCAISTSLHGDTAYNGTAEAYPEHLSETPALLVQHHSLARHSLLGTEEPWPGIGRDSLAPPGGATR